MKELNLHFWVRFPSDFKDNTIKSMIRCFLQGYVHGKLEDVPDNQMGDALSNINYENILYGLQSAFFTELSFKNVEITNYKKEIIQNETNIQVSFWIDFDIEEKDYKCMIAFPAK